MPEDVPVMRMAPLVWTGKLGRGATSTTKYSAMAIMATATARVANEAMAVELISELTDLNPKKVKMRNFHINF